MRWVFKITMENNNSQKNKLKITMDSGVNLKRLNILKERGLIEIHDVKGENYAHSVKNRENAAFVLEHSCFDEDDILLDKDGVRRYNDIRTIIGNDNYKDAIKLEAHIREGLDYFVTNNPRDFIYDGKRESLQSRFKDLKIITIEELEKICQK